MQKSLTAQPISSTDAPLAATFLIGKSSRERSPKPDWKRKGAIAGVAVTSAGIVLPLAGEQAIAYEGKSGQTDMAGRISSRQQTVVQPMAGAIKPQTSAAAQASFSVQSRGQSQSQSQSQGQATTLVSSSSVNSLLARAQDGSLNLSYSLPANLSGGQTQAVVAELVSATKAQAAANSSNSKAQAVELAADSTVDSNLFAARQKVQELQQQLANFEAARGQQDMAAYRNVLASRLAEIAEQSTRLDANIERNQRILTQLKMRLLTVDADVSLPNLVLATDEEYQAVWARLQKAEQNMQEEFSAANVDGTRLNEIYSDYKYHQQWLAKSAEQAFPSYVMSDEGGQIGFISQAPSAIDIMQNLVVATHQDRVQQLRRETLDTISQRLSSRRSELTADIGEYEQIQRELAVATEVAAEYEQKGTRQANAAKGQLVVDRSSAPVDATEAEVDSGAETDSAVSRAQLLAPYFANGTLSKTLLGIAIAAGALATAAVQHRAQKKSRVSDWEPLVEPSAPPFAQPAAQSLEAFSIAPAAEAVDKDLSSFSLYGESEPAGVDPLADELLETVLSSAAPEVAAEPISTDALLAELLEITRGDQSLAAYQSHRPVAIARTEASLVEELSEIIQDGDSTDERVAVSVSAVNSVEDVLGVEGMVRELEAIINVSGPALAPSSRILPAKAATVTDPIRLSVKEVDLFAEQVIRWVLNDLGFQMVNSSNMATEG